MQKFLQKFNELYKEAKDLEIEFLDDNPLSIKYVRYNQGGDVCHCREGETTASQKNKNKWQQIECNTEKCQYRQKDAKGKMACNRIGWLRFSIPSVCKDRIWLMKITGQSSINLLDKYFKMQKVLGNSIKGQYVLYLRQKSQTSMITGETYNNYVLHILRKEEFFNSTQIPQTVETSEKLPTVNAQNVNNNVVNQEKPKDITQQATINTQDKDKKTTSKTTKKSNTTKSKANKSEEKGEKETTKKSEEVDKYKNCYYLESTYNQEITDKKGNKKSYLIGKFYDMKDNEIHIVIKPEDAVELQKCDLGTVCEIELQDALERKFAVGLKFIQKCIKKEVA